MYVLYLAFANDSQSPLPELKIEDEEVYRCLIPNALQEHYLIHRESFASVENIREFLILYRDYVFLFSFSGHAGRDRLLMDKDEALVGGLAKLLGRCPNLKLVVLNGCSTKGQVQNLLDAGVPTVIATSAPVGDRSAKDFGISFFQALSYGESFQDSFDAAIGAALLKKKDLNIERSEGPGIQGDADLPLWGLYAKEASNLQLSLPKQKPVIKPIDFEPNSIFIAKLVEALTGQSDEIDFLLTKEKNHKTISESRKRMAVLNSLPAPVAEHLRKLMVPILDEHDGYDKLSKKRLHQLIKTYEVTSELMAFTLLAQFWEAKILHPDLVIPNEQAKVINNFLTISLDLRKIFDYISLIRAIRLIFDQEHNKLLINYFVPELEVIKELPYQNEDFMNATFFLQTVRQRLVVGELDEEECMNLCVRTEESLAQIFSRLGFMAKYQLAAVNSIDIEKYRHTTTTKFKHDVVRLIDLLGGLEHSEIEMERFTYNRSVLLLREDKELSELNLTPFIIDKNAFEKDADVSNIYFYSHFDAAADTYYYYYVNNPDEECLAVSNQEYQVIKEQMDAFRLLFKEGSTV